jgi:hypothetical protein
METRLEEMEHGPDCPECKKRMEEVAKQEEVNFAVLVALVPVMVFTFISTAGLF